MSGVKRPRPRAAQFTWALKRYNAADDDGEREDYARKMATYIRNARADGFTLEQTTKGKSYPAAEVQKFLDDPDTIDQAPTEEEIAAEIAQAVDTSNVKRRGTGTGAVYAYGYRGYPDRLKIGRTEGDTVERIADQIGTSTPDTPVLLLEIKTDASRKMEKALHAVLDAQGKKVKGGGDEWFLTTVDEIESLCDLLERRATPQQES